MKYPFQETIFPGSPILKGKEFDVAMTQWNLTEAIRNRDMLAAIPKLSNAELSEALRLSPSVITRVNTRWALVTEGLARVVEKL